MLTDSSVFDFYNNLIDGDNKGATARWTNYNIDLTQNAWGDRVGLNLTRRVVFARSEAER
jgi:hypothetical protein